MTSRVLVIDDEPLMREYVVETLMRAGHDVESAAGGAEGVEALRNRAFDVLVTDLKMTPMDGLEVLRCAKAENEETACILMTAYGTVETAVKALKDGAEDYILKPFAPDELELAVARALERNKLRQENRYLRAEVSREFDSGAMVGKSSVMREVYEHIKKVADSRATVLVRGETGTGKELVARSIHNSGPRRDQPFIKVNCAALSAGLLESELFGHERGSFTGAHERKIGRFELADGGTLLLDEISEMALELQPKLLRALQEREFERVGGTRSIQVDARIVCTSNRNLEKAVEDGKFREDLFFRLNVIPIHIPPLRERKEDIHALTDHFVKRFASENGRAVSGVNNEVRNLFMQYDWPGNVRELQNVIERAVVLSNTTVLTPAQVVLNMNLRQRNHGNGRTLGPGTTVAEMEKQLIFSTLEHCKQNRTQAAKLLGISVRTLRNKLKEYQIDSPET